MNKKLSFTFLCLLWLNTTLFAQLTQQTSGTTLNLFSVFFTAPDTGYIVGDNGIILKTTNGGANWLPQTSGAGINSLVSVFFTDRDTGYVLGNGFFKTTDGGANWIQQLPSLGDLHSIYFTSPDTGYAVGAGALFQPAAIFKTTNGGVSWTAQSSGTVTGVALRSVFFTAKDTGYAVGTGGTIVKTTDGGTNWIQLSSTGYGLSSVYFITSDTGYAVGDEGTILITTDGGVNWATQASGISGPTNPLRSVYFTDADTGYAVGGLSSNSSIILKTTNGGANWIQQTSGTTNSLYSVFFTDADTGYAVGFWGTILKTTNGGVVGVEEKNNEDCIKIYPNPTSGKFQIQLATGNWQLASSQKQEASIEIYNVLGEKVYSTTVTPINNERLTINLSALSDGIYFYRLVSAGKTIQQGKLVVLK